MADDITETNAGVVTKPEIHKRWAFLDKFKRGAKSGSSSEFGVPVESAANKVLIPPDSGLQKLIDGSNMSELGLVAPDLVRFAKSGELVALDPRMVGLGMPEYPQSEQEARDMGDSIRPEVIDRLLGGDVRVTMALARVLQDRLQKGKDLSIVDIDKEKARENPQLYREDFQLKRKIGALNNITSFDKSQVDIFKDGASKNDLLEHSRIGQLVKVAISRPAVTFNRRPSA